MTEGGPKPAVTQYYDGKAKEKEKEIVTHGIATMVCLGSSATSVSFIKTISIRG